MIISILLPEFAKLHPMHASVVCEPTSSRVNVPSVPSVPRCQYRSQRAKHVPVVQLGVPICQKACQFFNFPYQKTYQFLIYFSKKCFSVFEIFKYA